ncbi:YkgJ family cysteine cluster protein [Paenibacillus tarimensis]
MDCRVGCAACCIVISISSPIPGMPEGKPAGVRCIQLTSENQCRLFGKPDRPAVCSSLRPSEEMCDSSNEAAFKILEAIEEATKPQIDDKRNF